MKLINRLDYRILVLLIFGIVYYFALTFVYIEGDDSFTMAYHAMGRHASLQPPYSAYHGMMDKILSYQPASEESVRVFGIAFTSIFACLFALAVLELAFRWFDIDKQKRLLITVITLLAVPEFFFFGLVYTPSVVGMTFVVLAHIAVRTNFFDPMGEAVNNRNLVMYVISLALFGLGVSCRWDVAVYGAFIVLDLLLSNGKNMFSAITKIGRTVSILAWGLLSLASLIVFIKVSGYSMHDIKDVLQFTGKTVGEKASFTATAFLGFLSLFTPALIIMLANGVLSSLRSSRKYILLVGLALIFTAPFVMAGAAKAFIFSMVIYVSVAIYGLANLLEYIKRQRDQRRNILRIGFLAILLGIWFIGIRIYSDKAWGPSFELTQHKYDEKGKIKGKTHGVSLAIGSGMAIPTQEGARPIGGYFFVFLKQWRNLYTAVDLAATRNIEVCHEKKISVLQDDNNAGIIIVLANRGFVTNDAYIKSPKIFSARIFTNNQDTITDFVFSDKRKLFKKSMIDTLWKKYGKDEILLYSGYPSTIAKMLKEYGTAFEMVSPLSGILNLKKYSELLLSKPAHADPKD